MLQRLTMAAAIAAVAGCASDPNYMGLDANDHDAADTGGTDAGATETIVNNPVPPPAGVVAAGVRWFGRVDTTNAAQPRFSWSGTGFVARFSGTALAASLQITGTSAIFKTVVDGAPQAPFTATSGTATYMLATGLSADVHTVEVYRQTEGPQGEARLMGLTVGGGGALMDPPMGLNRLIEVIGDSISCGYGNLGKNGDADCFPTESHWDTYGAIAARALGAEVSTIAASGRGVIRNYGGEMTGTMPLLYPGTIANLANPVWDFHIEPQAVVINLGTNDLSNGKGDPGVPFQETYLTLVETIRARYPRAYILCTIGPLTSTGEAAIVAGYVRNVVQARAAAGDTQVELFDQILPQTQDKFACAYHPNAAENAIVAGQLADRLRAKLGW